jgi:hypothetical protein
MSDTIEQAFSKMGARAKVAVLTATARPARLWNGAARPVQSQASFLADIERDARGDYFSLRRRREVVVRVLDVRQSDRQLLLSALDPQAPVPDHRESRFLCGRDESSWFVAAIPETADARDVQGAMDALKPDEVWESIRAWRLPMELRDQRRTAAFVRQGEWFFIPRPALTVPPSQVLEDEPISRAGGKPHLCQYLYRTGGEEVFVSNVHPNGLTKLEYDNLPRVERRGLRWTRMARDARAYVRGCVRHVDHKSIWLRGWHEVVMNTETKARAMEHVVFLD